MKLLLIGFSCWALWGSEPPATPGPLLDTAVSSKSECEANPQPGYICWPISRPYCQKPLDELVGAGWISNPHATWATICGYCDGREE